ncbi:MAG: septum site-determining protein MinC [Legionellales bacterium RIFCSPHIGHO2_12_FULL_37_14]|nr:MAG: septum site-determining protein MinC [Legionellales bacterium RIFCSPHIGHO2_12_FULL_37_14]
MSNANTLQTQSFKLKGRLYTLTVMALLSEDLAAFKVTLNNTIAKAPKLFQAMPIVLDCTAIGNNELDLAAFVQFMRANQVFPVAVQGGNSYINTLAELQGLAILSSANQQEKNNTPEMSQKWSHTKVQHTTVRSGQQVVARNSDLVVMAAVGQGAELLADGNIYVYGALRGRALAGISGYAYARIFCQSLQAELIAINGVYRLNESMNKMEEPCQIYLQAGKIIIEPLTGNSLL